MMTEIVRITIDPARAPDFIAAVQKSAETVQSRADGCRSMRLERILENPAQYLLMVGWDSVEHHTVTFRHSGLYNEWRTLAGPFFEDLPKVDHVETVATFF